LDKAANALALATSPVVRALVDPEGAMRDIRDLDKISFSDWFTSHGGTRMSIKRMWDPIAYALGFIDCDNISARCMLTIFAFFATKTEASLLRMLNGSPDMRLSGPISKYITDRGGRLHSSQQCFSQMFLIPITVSEFYRYMM
jgi:zeta-carotene desaturase